MPEIISRKEAKARGLKRYFTGKPCWHGHLAYRLCASEACTECERGARLRAKLRRGGILPPAPKGRPHGAKRFGESARERALEVGVKTYSSTQSCVHGHKGLRFVSNRHCVECSKARYYQDRVQKQQESRERTEKWRRRARIAIAVIEQLGIEI